MFCKMGIFRDHKIRSWLIANHRIDRFLRNQIKPIQRGFARIALTFETKVQITRNKHIVKDIVNPRPLKRGLQPPMIFPATFLGNLLY